MDHCPGSGPRAAVAEARRSGPQWMWDAVAGPLPWCVLGVWEERSLGQSPGLLTGSGHKRSSWTYSPALRLGVDSLSLLSMWEGTSGSSVTLRKPGGAEGILTCLEEP